MCRTSSRGRNGADARLGADCSGFLIYGRRRLGEEVPYVNPQGLMRYLTQVDEVHGFSRGVALGDRGPIVVTEAEVYEGAGTLRNTTPVVHQLEGVPEITTLGAMAAKYPKIRLMKWVTNEHEKLQ